MSNKSRALLIPATIAIRQGDVENLRVVLESVDFDVNMRDRDGNSLLELAVGLQNPEMVELLLKHGANPNLPDEIGRTSLHYAALHSGDQALPIAQQLLNHGARSSKDELDKTPADIAFLQEVRIALIAPQRNADGGGYKSR